MENNYCLFCDRNNRDEHTILLENEFCYAKQDKFPVSSGHLLIIPKPHIVSFFELSDEQLVSLYSLLKEAKLLIQTKYYPDGYNIGVNEGEVAGRTVHHLHIHLIPRYQGDITDPRGGIRNVIPDQGNHPE